MGLDMYAFSSPQCTDVPEGAKWRAFNFNREEIAYWREFDELHCWMENLARRKGFRGEFDCVPVLLTPADLDQLESDLEAELLQPVDGLTSEEKPIYLENVEATRVFITRARKCHESGRDVSYDSWR